MVQNNEDSGKMKVDENDEEMKEAGAYGGATVSYDMSNYGASCSKTKSKDM